MMYTYINTSIIYIYAIILYGYVQSGIQNNKPDLNYPNLFLLINPGIPMCGDDEMSIFNIQNEP